MFVSSPIIDGQHGGAAPAAPAAAASVISRLSPVADA